MTSIRNAKIWTGVASGVLGALLLVIPGHPQRATDPALRTTTSERLETEPWWPTKANLPLSAFAGSASCSQCHVEEASAPPSAMRRAANPAAVDGFLASKTPHAYTQLPLIYSLAKSSTGLDYSVSDGSHTLSHRLDWVLGAGELGRTFLYEADGRWFQSQLSFYTKPAALDVTTGFDSDPHAPLASTLGQPLTPDEARACFGCHTVHATTSAGLQPLHAEPGLGCEACHGPGRAHTAAKTTASIFNPARLAPADSIDFCGSCHRTFADATGGPATTAKVRFQPYRLQESKCWRVTQDERLTCVNCHNPHEPLSHDAAAYDKTCLSCHSPSAATPPAHVAAAVCPKSTRDCTSCHMPKVEIASMHGTFTDHFIRVAHPGDPFPK